MDDGDDRWGDVVPTDEILRRLPQISGQRRLRLMCRRWRDVVDEVEPEVQRRRANPLVFFKDGRYEPPSAFLLHDLAGDDCDVTSLSLFCKEEDGGGGDRDFFARYNNDDKVGSCNGLICLWFDRDPLYYGSIVVINPVTGESLHVPSPPMVGWWTMSRWAAGDLGEAAPSSPPSLSGDGLHAAPGPVASNDNDDMVGSCNCLWLKRHPLVCGSIIVINPVTGESLHIPSPPLAWWRAVKVPPWSPCTAWGVVSVDGAT
uniref:F-box domain-containing protein n=1 Tax=Oryza barthii TaxID=65489 RepID=A0A0D3HUP2_9ORYZ